MVHRDYITDTTTYSISMSHPDTIHLQYWYVRYIVRYSNGTSIYFLRFCLHPQHYSTSSNFPLQKCESNTFTTRCQSYQPIIFYPFVRLYLRGKPILFFGFAGASAFLPCFIFSSRRQHASHFTQ